MGLCFSCLGSGSDDSENNERTSLLGSHNLYSDENLQEELLKQQQRQNELSTIVNDLSDNLIDVSTFLSNTPNGVTTGGEMLYLNASLGNETEDLNGSALTSPGVGPADDERLYPYLLSVEEKVQILKAVDNLDDELKHFEMEEASGPLYVTF